MTRAGAEYAGTVDYTKSGVPCHPWSDSTSQSLTTFPEGRADRAGANCRNPMPGAFFGGVWCHTDALISWELCSVPLCACTKWETVINTYSPMGRYFTNHTNVTDCLNACVSLYSDGSVYCNGVDISTETVGCWFHFDDSDLQSTAVQWNGVNQYRRVRNCTSNEIVIDDQALYGVATYQSSTIVVYASNKSIDGLIDPNGCQPLKSCSGTRSTDLNPWWAIDLGASFEIAAVAITSADTTGYEVKNVIIAVTDLSPDTIPPSPTTYSICSTFAGTIPVMQTFNFSCLAETPPSRYIAVQIPFYLGMLAMAEVQIYVNQTGEHLRSNFSPPASPVSQVSDAYVIVGCFADSELNRDLSYLALNSSNMTHLLCVSACANGSYLYSGLQDSHSCFCGNSFGVMGQSEACNSTCAGDPTLVCGGHLANTVIYNKLVCTKWNVRSLTFSLGAIRYPQYNTVNDCKNACMHVFAGCVAIDVGQKLVECWVHYFNNTRLVHNMSWVNVDQYRMTGCYVPISTKGPTTTMTTTTATIRTGTSFKSTAASTSESHSLTSQLFSTTNADTITVPSNETAILSGVTSYNTNMSIATSFETDLVKNHTNISVSQAETVATPTETLTVSEETDSSFFISVSITEAATLSNEGEATSENDNPSNFSPVGASLVSNHSNISASVTETGATETLISSAETDVIFLSNDATYSTSNIRTIIVTNNSTISLPTVGSNSSVRAATVSASSTHKNSLPGISKAGDYDSDPTTDVSYAIEVASVSKEPNISGGNIVSEATTALEIPVSKATVKITWLEISQRMDNETFSVPVPCDFPPPVIRNADVFLYRDEYGMVAIYSCDLGFCFQGGGRTRSAHCGQAAKWQAKLPDCIPVICDLQKDLKKTRLDWNDVPSISSSQVAISRCTDGERFRDGSSDESIKCVVMGEQGFSHRPESDCAGYRCQAPPLLEHASVRLNQTAKTLQITCFAGYRFSDGTRETSVTCNENGGWDIHHQCHAIYCEKLHQSSTFSLSTNDTIYGTIVVISCLEGFMFADRNLTKYLQCTVNVLWNDTLSEVCEAVFCPDPPSIQYTNRFGLETRNGNGSFPYGTVISYVCLDGRKFDDGHTKTGIWCTGNGYWLQKVFSCDYNRCDPVPAANFSTPNSTNTYAGSVVEYRCNLGYIFHANATRAIKCDGNKWNSSASDCIPIHCPHLSDRHATLNSTERVFGSITSLECDSGYEVFNQSSVVVNCLLTGFWSPENVTCTPVDCGNPPNLLNAEVIVGQTTFDHNVSYRCLPGFWFSRDVYEQSVRCQENRRWSNVNHTKNFCRPVTCPPLLLQIVNSTDVRPHTTLNVTCPKGQKFRWDHATTIEITCDLRGNWNPTVPDCIDVQKRSTATRVTEAHGSTYFGFIAMSTAGSIIFGLLLIDLRHLIIALKNIKTRIRRTTRSKSEIARTNCSSKHCNNEGQRKTDES